MGFLDISIGGDKSENDPTKTDTTKYGRASTFTQILSLWRKTHPRLTFLGLLTFTGAVLYILVPWGLLYFLPDVVGLLVLYGGLGAVIGWYGSTKKLQHDFDPEIDIIYQNNAAQSPSIKRWKYKAGLFLDEFDFSDVEDKQPNIEFREDGTRIIQVDKIDIDEKRAEGYWAGALSQDEYKRWQKSLAVTKRWLENQGQKSSKLRYEFNQIKSKGLTAAINSTVRKLDEIKYPDSINNEVNDELPDSIQKRDTAEDLMDDLVDDYDKTQEQLKADLEANADGKQ